MENYFELMGHAHRSGAKICSDDDGASWPLDTNSRQMLRAAGFLVLYNLVEATISDGISVIMKTIEGENIEFVKATETLRSLWIKQRIGTKTQPNRIMREARALIDDALNKVVVRIDRKTVMMGGGNLDAERIREIAGVVGFEHSAGPEAEKGSGSLELVKKKRNSLAHGHFGFLEVGRDFSDADMCKFKDEVVRYLGAVLGNMNQYVTLRAYLSN